MSTTSLAKQADEILTRGFAPIGNGGKTKAARALPKPEDYGIIDPRKLDQFYFAACATDRLDGFRDDRDQHDEQALAEQDRAIRQVRKVLSRLTARQREIYDLYCQGLKQQEIADRLGITQPTVYKTLHGNHIYQPDGTAIRYGGIVKRIQTLFAAGAHRQSTTPKSQSKPIWALERRTGLVRHFWSISQAAQELGLGRKNIKDQIRRKPKAKMRSANAFFLTEPTQDEIAAQLYQWYWIKEIRTGKITRCECEREVIALTGVSPPKIYRALAAYGKLDSKFMIWRQHQHPEPSGMPLQSI